MNLFEKSQFIKTLSASAGFEFCGIAKARYLDDDARRLEKWLHQGMHGTMSYMERYFDLRVNPQVLIPGAKSVICFLCNYYPSARQNKQSPKISKYAYGKDYHAIIRSKINFMIGEMRKKFGDFQGRGFVDSAPVLERSWAVQSGLGWVGKNGNLINKKRGSFFFIATLITDLELAFDLPSVNEYCGTCTKCIDACPTQAISTEKIVDGSKCISYFTIELKDLLIPNSMKDKFDDWMFGCDTCQDVCPWNRFSEPTKDPAFEPLHDTLEYTEKDWEQLNEESFKIIFSSSALSRTKWQGIQRNLKFLKK